MKSTVFISGTGRCGTNILKDILSNHNAVASLPFEHRYTVDPDGIFDFYRSMDTWSPFIADRRIKRLVKFLKSLSAKSLDEVELSKKTGIKSSYQDWELDKWIPGYSGYVDNLINEIVAFSYDARHPGNPKVSPMMYQKNERHKVKSALINFQNSCNASVISSKKKEMFIEDNTWTFLFAREALELTPNSFLIHMVRDPRDVISSMMEQSWTPSNLSHLIQYYKDLIGAWNNQKSQLDSETFVEVKFENFISEPEIELGRLCELIGLPYDNNMLNLDLTKSNLGRYKTTFKKEEIDLLNEALKDILIQYNYN